jgi:ketosteroid isomerase-like protein
MTNVEILRRAYEGFNRGELEEAAVVIAPDCEYVTTGIVPGSAGVHRGPEGYVRFVRWIQDEFDDAQVEAHELIDAGEYVVAALTISGSGKQSGAPASWDVWQVWRFRDGLAVHGQAFTSREDAFEAAELDRRRIG